MSVGTAEKITIRLPVATPREIVGEPAYTVDRPLEGLRVGMRHEGSWRSWMLIVDVWEEYLRRDGAIPVILKTGERVGEEGVQTRARVEEWSLDVDAGVAGLGTCGSCTSWSVHDAVSLESAHKPSVVAVTSEFETHARNMANHLSHPDLKVLVLAATLARRPR